MAGAGADEWSALVTYFRGGKKNLVCSFVVCPCLAQDQPRTTKKPRESRKNDPTTTKETTQIDFWTGQIIGLLINNLHVRAE